MEPPHLLLEPELRDHVVGFFEPRAAAVDRGDAGIRESLEFLHDRVLHQATNGDQPNADLVHIAQVIATVAWSDMSSAFTLWCHRMVLEYLAQAPAGSPLRTEVLPRIASVEVLGSTALAGAMAYYLGQAPLPITAQRDGDGLTLNGRVNWASNLFVPDFLMVTAAARTGDGRPVVVALPGGADGVCVDPYPQLLALQATGSSSVVIRDARVEPEWIVTDDFPAFIRRIRPPFLLLQSSFCWGLAHRAVTEAREALRGVNEVLRPDLERLERTAEHLAVAIRRGASDRGQSMTMRDVVQLRLDCARLATTAVALEAKAMGGRGYVNTAPTARRLREAAFLPIQAPTEGQLRWELAHCA
ncbi:MAG: acyl-CoA/acyl-ACP dehydrogenase [Chloroflexi bacterium]|nr:acyl-CoA/acyl-ACP dehydrogenase [Chloroflexota bacterium]